jgi:hypothetical protein
MPPPTEHDELGAAVLSHGVPVLKSDGRASLYVIDVLVHGDHALYEPPKHRTPTRGFAHAASSTSAES